MPGSVRFGKRQLVLEICAEALAVTVVLSVIPVNSCLKSLDRRTGPFTWLRLAQYVGGSRATATTARRSVRDRLGTGVLLYRTIPAKGQMGTQPLGRGGLTRNI